MRPDWLDEIAPDEDARPRSFDEETAAQFADRLREHYRQRRGGYELGPAHLRLALVAENLERRFKRGLPSWADGSPPPKLTVVQGGRDG